MYLRKGKNKFRRYISFFHPSFPDTSFYFRLGLTNILLLNI